MMVRMVASFSRHQRIDFAKMLVSPPSFVKLYLIQYDVTSDIHYLFTRVSLTKKWQDVELL